MQLLPARREGFGEERYEKAEMQARVKQCFEGLRQPDWCVVDASQSIEAIHEQIWAHAQAVVARCAAGQAPLRQLWDGAELALLAGQGGQRPLLGNITNSTTAAAARPQQDAAGSKGQQQQQPQEQQPQSS